MGKIVYELMDEDMEFLKEQHGPLFKDMDELERAVAGKKVYSVGDFTSYNLIGRNKIDLQAVFYDGRTRRGPIPQYMIEGISKWGESEVKIGNPKGTITEDLISAAKSCESKQQRVYVEGEEDLAALALFTVLEYGSVVAYGLPDANGTCAVTVTPEIRKAALSLKGWKNKPE